MKKDNLSSLLKKYSKGNISNEEKDKVERFFGIFQNLNITKTELTRKDIERIKNSTYESVKKHTISKSRKRQIAISTKVAATILVLLTIGFLVKNNLSSHYSQKVITAYASYGQQKTIVLNDSSVVTLNSGSSLTYPEIFEPQSRKVTLSGEAFFKVSKNPNRPFIITSDQVTTTVLGTSFNISAYPDETNTVTVSTGKVKVELNNFDNKHEIITPGEQVYVNSENNELYRKQVNAESYTGWQHNILKFENKYLHEIFKTLERYYNVSIICNDQKLLNKKLTTQYNNVNILQIIKNLQYMLEFNYEIKGNSININYSN